MASPRNFAGSSPLTTPPESPVLAPPLFPRLGEPTSELPHMKEITEVTLVGEQEEIDDGVSVTKAKDFAMARATATISKSQTPSRPSPITTADPLAEVSGRLEKMSERLNAGVLSEPLATVEDTDAIDDFLPHILHAPHKRMPMVLVNRKPRGMPGHQDLRTAQNAAWLAGCYHANKSVFIQTPTFNARPAVDACLDACRRGVIVTIYMGLGFNDKGESIPFQGGTNQEVAIRMFKALKREGKEDFLKLYWYVAKDQSRPINAVQKQRNCHVKLAIFDDVVGMMGNGNQDTQSWYHSQEVNVLLDSPQICTDWLHALKANQNTHLYGLLDTDGIWRSPEGRTVEQLDAALEREKAEAVTP